MAPSTLGTFLRAFTFGHVRQLDRPGSDADACVAGGRRSRRRRLVVDVDSFVGAVHGRAKQGAAFGYTRVRGYHPIVATCADSGEVLPSACAKGSANTLEGCCASQTS